MSCLFNSLGKLLNVDSMHLRQHICDALRDDVPIIDGMSTHDVLRIAEGSEPSLYVSRMRSPSTWGGAIEIQTACVLFNLRVIVQNRRDAAASTIEFVPHATPPSHTATIYWTGGHYEPVAITAP